MGVAVSPSVGSQVNYRPKVLVKGAPSSLYSQLPDTLQIQFAREMTEVQSEVEQHQGVEPSLTSSYKVVTENSP